MQCIPFQLIDLGTEKSQKTWSLSELPGQVDDPRVIKDLSPKEIGIKVLSSIHYTVHSIRVEFQKNHWPSKLQLYISKSRPDCALDTLSQYFDAVFEPIREVIEWPREYPTQVVLSLGSVPVRCTFLKLLLFEPLMEYDLVILKSIKVLGFFEVPNPSISVRGEGTVTAFADVETDLRNLLESTGLSSNLIDEIANQQQPDAVTTGSSEAAPFPSIVSDNMVQGVEVTPSPQDMDKTGEILDSVFDRAMREYIKVQEEQEAMLATLCSNSPRISVSLKQPQSPVLLTIRKHDPGHLESIIAYTFGAFITQCLLHDSDETCAQAVQVVERFTPLLLRVEMPSELVYEGLIAVICLTSTNGSCSCDVFHALLHLIRTLFQVREDDQWSMITKITKGKINTGIRMILNRLLRETHCWTIVLGSRTSSTGIGINREFLHTIRLLMQQSHTSTSFYHALVPNNHDSESLQTVLNRIRLIRWLLMRHYEQLPSTCMENFRRYFELVQTEFDGAPQAAWRKIDDVVSQCLMLLTKQTQASCKKVGNQHLIHIKKQPLPAVNVEEKLQVHRPLYIQYPLTEQQENRLVTRARQYFTLHQRPVALYQHYFTNESLEAHDGAFRMGNIQFIGHVEPRKLPDRSFHDHMTLMTKPFAFDLKSESGEGARVVKVGEKVEVTTTFSTFRGTIEERREDATSSTKRSVSNDKLVKLKQETSEHMNRTVSPKLNQVVPMMSLPNAIPIVAQPSLQPTTQSEVPTSSSALPKSAPSGERSDVPTPVRELPKTAPDGERPQVQTSDGQAEKCCIQ